MGHFPIIIRPFRTEWPDPSWEMAHTAKEKKNQNYKLFTYLANEKEKKEA